MDLVSLTVRGWRRFQERTTLQTNGKIVSVLGPNEAGKSSLLRALQFLRTSDDVEQGELSRGSSADHLEIKGYFALSKADLSGAGLNTPTRLVLTKKSSGSATYTLEPAPPARDVSRRVKVKDQIDKCLDNPKFHDSLSEEDIDALRQLQAALDGENENINKEDIAILTRLSELVRRAIFPRAPQYVRFLGDELANLAEEEVTLSPRERANRYVRGRIPQVLMFGDEERNLRQDYSLDALASEIPTALANLASIADLDISALISAVNAGDTAEIETIRAQANHRLRERFEETWSQSGVHVSIAVNNRVLNVVIENEPFRFTNLAERSDGFRQFVALQSFVMKAHANQPILLIDEAELHLHYDAQADLIQMLSRQEVAGKIIYTTHSAGCLPEDLGNGVRLVSQTGASTSKIINRFWGTSEPGFSPMLIGMGASTLAFFPTRKALIVEGESEMLLLPTMAREILKVSILGFQTVPGLSKANKSLLPIVGTEARHIAYLTDGDEGGQALTRELKRNKVDQGGIFALETEAGNDCQLEDFLDNQVLGRAVNAVIEKFSPGAKAIASRGAPTTGKFAHFADLFETSTGKKLLKVDVAYEVLQLAADDTYLKIVDPGHAKSFEGVMSRIARFLS